MSSWRKQASAHNKLIDTLTIYKGSDMNLHKTINPLFVLVFLSISSAALADYVMNAQTAKLVDCGDKVAYAARYYLMMNNEGMAKNLIQEYSKAQIALLSKHYVNGAISGEKIAAFRSREKLNTSYMDTNQNNIPNIVNECRHVISNAVNDPAIRNVKMWGKNFSDLVGEMSASVRSQYGL